MAAIDDIGKSVAFSEVVWLCVILYEMSIDGHRCRQVISDTTRLALCSCTIEVSDPAEKSSWALKMSILSADGVAARRARGAQFRG